jgi:NAD(P)-dependent dehydrogenase (short-subunit alcohol dehydrogenase family)
MPVAIVTGGSRGLGEALVAGLLERGWSVVTDARDDGALAATAHRLRATSSPSQAGATRGGAAAGVLVAVPGDVTDARHRRELVAAATALGPLGLVVNNAGGLGPSPLPNLAGYPVDALSELFEVNVAAPLALVQEALPALRSAGGVIVNITSDAGVEGYPGWGGYGATKAALDQVSRVLAAEEPDVAVYAIDPGDLRTRMHQDAFPGEDISDRPLPEASIPGLRGLVEGPFPSGRYQVSDVPAPLEVA